VTALSPCKGHGYLSETCYTFAEMIYMIHTFWKGREQGAKGREQRAATFYFRKIRNKK
jgi:hypothetical protein